MTINPRHVKRLQVYSLLAAGTTVSAWLAPLHHVFDMLTHFRVQYAVTLALAACLNLAFRMPRTAAVLAAFAVMNGAYVVPSFVPDTPSVVSTSRELTIMSYNVLYENLDLAAARAEIETAHADVVLLLELTPRVAADLDLAGLGYKFSVTHLRGDAFGIGLFSRLPLRNGRVEVFGDNASPSIVAHVESQDGTPLIEIFGMHPFPPVTDTKTRQRDSTLQGAARAVALAAADGPVVMMGDFNLTPWTDSFATLLLTSGLKDSRRGFGIQATWPAWNQVLGIPIDHVLVTPDVSVLSRTIGGNGGSDHLPVIARLSVPEQRLVSLRSP